MEVSNTSNKENNKFTRNVAMVAFSNILTILSGVLAGFVLPKIMGVTDYGYYKIFTLYYTYVGILSFGFVDGIYLLFAGKNYDSLDKNKFLLFTRFMCIFQIIITIIITGISLIFIKSYYGFIFMFIGIGLITNNITSYYQYISQITYRFKELAIRNTIKSLLTIISILILLFIYEFYDIDVITYQIYIYVFTSINIFLLIWYIYSYKDITFGKIRNKIEIKREIFHIFRVGMPLLLSNLVGTLILTIDRQFVSILFDTDTYSIYAFAYNMLNLVTTAISAISTVLYPSLKVKTEDELKDNYDKLNGIIFIIVATCMLAYFPLVLIVNWFLPEYKNSLIIFQVIFPSLLFNTSITVVMSNYYKSLNLVNSYFVKSITALLLAFIANMIAYYTFKTPISISIASVIVSIIWYFMMEVTIIKRWKTIYIKNTLFSLLVLICFYVITYFIKNIYVSGFTYLSSLIILIVIFQKNNFLNLIKRKII